MIWQFGLQFAFASTLYAQDTTKAARDSAAIADSLRLVEELEREAKAANQGADGAQQPVAYGPTNPRLLPDISAVGDLVGDLSPDGSTQEDGTRFGVREVELAVQAAVDPYFRGDVFLGINDVEKIAVEQAYLTATSLPYSIEGRLGRFLMPFGKQNTIHRHDLHTLEYPYVIQRFLSPEGLTGTGLWASKIFAPLGFYQEFLATGINTFGEQPEDLTTAEPINKNLSGLGYSARLRNYVDLSESSNVELSGSFITGERAQPLESAIDAVNAVAARQSLVGMDFTYRWRPLQQGLYRSFILQAEYMWQLNQLSPDLPIGGIYAGPPRDISGGYVFARYQLTRRLFVGSRGDWVQNPSPADGSLKAISGDLEFYPSEFSKLLAQYERFQPGTGQDGINRFLLQAVFSLGPHKPHPF